MRSRAAPCAAIVGALLATTGCARHDAPQALTATLGAYDDGSGRVGIALLATLRDPSGAGPASTWALALRDADGEIPGTIDYAAPGAGSVLVRWRADVAPRPGTYELTATGDGQVVRAVATIESHAPLARPEPALSATGDAIGWPPVTGAAAYQCRVFAAGELRQAVTVVAPSCDVSGLAPGAYAASIAALSADPRDVDRGWKPALPDRFDASEATFGFVRPDAGAAPVVIRAAGGAYDYGIGPRSLAVWLSITGADGTPTAETWDVEITGPGLPASDPLAATYWAGFPRQMLWAPGVPAFQGTYTVVARAGSALAVVPVVVGVPAALDMPFGVSATSGAQGGARATWDAVPGARAYLASAYDVETGEVATSLWVGGPAVDFPAGSFAAGRAYEIQVAASDADMAFGAVVPTQVSVVENVFDRASFVAR